MDEHDIAADLREVVLLADSFQGSQILEPPGDGAGFVLDNADGKYLVTVIPLEVV